MYNNDYLLKRSLFVITQGGSKCRASLRCFDQEVHSSPGGKIHEVPRPHPGESMELRRAFRETNPSN